MEGESRTVDIDLNGQEVITVDLDNLDPDPKDILDVLIDGHPKVSVWTKLAAEYWRRGHLDAAEKIARAAVQADDGTQDAGPIFSLLANIQMAHARAKPKIILSEAKQDILADKKIKEDSFREATNMLNRASSGQGDLSLSFLTRGILQLVTRSMDDAMRSFDAVLSDKPTNLVALLGKGRIQYARRQYRDALHSFQQVLRLNPSCQPDPRVGIGLCYWAMGNKTGAKAAWERSFQLSEEGKGDGWAAMLLLGLESINTSKNEGLDETERVGFYQTGIRYVERAFKASGSCNASAANALCELFLQKGNMQRSLKLAERTIQYADTLAVLTDGYVRAGRIAHIQGQNGVANKHYTAAQEGQKKNILANLGLAQMQITVDGYPGAIHTLDNLAQSIRPQECFEANAILASLRGLPRPEISSKDQLVERHRARDMFERITRRIQAQSEPNHNQPRVARLISDDMDMFIEIAGLWRGENLERTAAAISEALRLCQGQNEKAEVQLLNNLGALKHSIGGDGLEEARTLYERALVKAAALGEDGEGMSTTVLYNLARVYEDGGDEEKAQDAYTKLTGRHPEYVDAKLRLAHIQTTTHQHTSAHDLLKQALASTPGDLNVRAYYTYFLIQSGLPKPAKDFVFATLKDHDKHDIYALCAAGSILYTQARESRETAGKGMEERKRNFQRSAEFFEKALQLDGSCAYAAQGLAIVLAEDALGGLSAGGVNQESEGDRRARLRSALDVFGKVRESVSEDGGVYFNMGHCYYGRDEYDRAIESYETSLRTYGGQNTSVLMCLCRSWYAKATKDQSYKAMQTALKYAQRALHASPSDKAILYNIAMIQQKSAEMLFGIDPSKRHLKELQSVIEQAAGAQKLFASLAAAPAPMVPYSRDIADQRRKYGDNMLRKADEHLAKQRDHEAQVQDRLNKARMVRQKERDEVEQIEREKAERERIASTKLAEERRIARETAQAWTRDSRLYADSDEEKEKKPKRSRKSNVPTANNSGEDEPEGGKKKRKKGKLRKRQREDGEEGVEASEEEEVEKPVRKRKKRVIKDEDEEGDAPEKEVKAERKEGKSRGGKQFKSKEMLSDTDDEEPEAQMDVDQDDE